MTAKEMSEIFAVMLLAYPNAEIFKGGLAKLEPTVNLWVAALPDVDFWTGQQAVMKLVRECKFPPTIAEFKEKADSIKAEKNSLINSRWTMLKLRMDQVGIAEAVEEIPTESRERQVIRLMGGPEKLVVTSEHLFGDGRVVPYEHYNYDGYKQAWETLLSKESALASGTKRPAIGAGKKQIGG